MYKLATILDAALIMDHVIETNLVTLRLYKLYNSMIIHFTVTVAVVNKSGTYLAYKDYFLFAQ